MKAFIEQALRDRYDDFVWSDEILDEFIDDLVEICTEWGIPEGYTARTIIDNRYVNGERWTYEEYWNDYMRETGKYKGTEKQMDKIEEHMADHWYYYKRDKEIWTSM
jgi:hypothetical protein